VQNQQERACPKRAISRIMARRERAPGVTEASFRKAREKGRP